jgi:hypothetical protein
MNVDLPAPFGPSSPGDAGWYGDRHIIQAGDLAVPLREALGVDDHRSPTISE